jgi:hypothetical protein
VKKGLKQAGDWDQKSLGVPRAGRIIAGVSDSARCLRCAADLAHAHDGVLFPVHTWVPSARGLAGFRRSAGRGQTAHP